MGLKGILGHPDLELVGCFVARPERAGQDAGELVGRPHVGVTTTNRRRRAARDRCRLPQLLRLGARRHHRCDAVPRCRPQRRHHIARVVDPAAVRARSSSARRWKQRAGRETRRCSQPASNPASRATCCPRRCSHSSTRSTASTSPRSRSTGTRAARPCACSASASPAGEPVPLFASGAVTGLWGQVVHHLARRTRQTARRASS